MNHGKIYDYGLRIVQNFWDILLEMSPYLIFGFFVSGILSVVISKKWISRHLGGNNIVSTVKASLFGIPLPLCSCGIIPVSMSMNKQGASKGSTVSFLISTPQTGMDSIFVSYSLLGPIFAVVRPIVAFITGIIGGFLTALFSQSNEGKQEQFDDNEPKETNNNQKKWLTPAMKYGFITLPKDISKSLLIGLLLAGFITALIPENFFAEYLGTGILSKLTMIILGIPVYVCATASVPIAAAMILKGLSPGAALIFLMTGPATNAAAIVTIWQQLGKLPATIYLLSVAGASLVFGILLDIWMPQLNTELMRNDHWMIPENIKIISAITLITILLISTIKRDSNDENIEKTSC